MFMAFEERLVFQSYHLSVISITDLEDPNFLMGSFFSFLPHAQGTKLDLEELSHILMCLLFAYIPVSAHQPEIHPCIIYTWFNNLIFLTSHKLSTALL